MNPKQWKTGQLRQIARCHSTNTHKTSQSYSIKCLLEFRAVCVTPVDSRTLQSIKSSAHVAGMSTIRDENVFELRSFIYCNYRLRSSAIWVQSCVMMLWLKERSLPPISEWWGDNRFGGFPYSDITKASVCVEKGWGEVWISSLLPVYIFDCFRTDSVSYNQSEINSLSWPLEHIRVVILPAKIFTQICSFS